MKRWMKLSLLLVAFLVEAGCGRHEQQPNVSPPAKTEANSPAPVAAVPPASPEALAAIARVVGRPVPYQGLRSIPELKGHVRPGDAVVVAGKIMGSASPFSPDRAVMLLGDEDTVASCDLLGIDVPCPTPWDCHHEEPQAVKDGVATVQVLGADGNVIRAGLEGRNGLRLLGLVRVSGTIATDTTPEHIVINADAIQLREW